MQLQESLPGMQKNSIEFTDLEQFGTTQWACITSVAQNKPQFALF